jgi:pyruvate dehydrogenase (quinone)
MRIAKTERTVTCVIVPNDVQQMDTVETPPRKHGTVHSGIGHAPLRIVPSQDMNPAEPINPQRVFWDLSSRLPDDCIITCDSGSAANWYARDVKMRRGMKASLSGGLATMGPAVPYAIAAKFAFPDRPVIAAVGDGSMQMNGIAELLTAAKYWHRWSDPRLIVLVLNNRDFNQVTWDQRAMAGDPKYEGSQNVPDFPYAEYARLIGFKGICIDEPETIGAAWDEALAADRPVVIEAYTDGNVPPLPPHITMKQATAYASALLSRDPESMSIVRQSLRELRSSLMPGRGAH